MPFWVKYSPGQGLPSFRTSRRPTYPREGYIAKLIQREVGDAPEMTSRSSRHVELCVALKCLLEQKVQFSFSRSSTHVHTSKIV